jgi:hypothetical protein
LIIDGQPITIPLLKKPPRYEVVFLCTYALLLVSDVTLQKKWAQREGLSVEASAIVAVFMESIWSMG